MAFDKDAFLTALDSMSVMELNELVKAIEEKFGLSLLVHQSQLVTIDFLPRALPLRARHALLAVLGTITLVLFAYIGWLSWEWVQRDDVRIELSATTQLPRWYNYSAVPLALALLVWHQFVAILRDLHVVVKGAAQ